MMMVVVPVPLHARGPTTTTNGVAYMNRKTMQTMQVTTNSILLITPQNNNNNNDDTLKSTGIACVWPSEKVSEHREYYVMILINSFPYYYSHRD